MHVLLVFSVHYQCESAQKSRMKFAYFGGLFL